MSLLNLFKIICFTFLALTVAALSANKDFKIYEMESGQVLYELSGDGQLTQETNLSVSGKARLRFKEWGAVALVEERGAVSAVGAIREKQTFRSLVKQEKDTTLHAYYKTEKVLERKSSSKYSVHGEAQTRNLKKTGTMDIAGLQCDVWEGSGVKKCLYEGVPLLFEIRLHGIVYTKKASDVNFDINISDDKCMVPDFSIEEFGLIRGIGMTKNKRKPKEVIEIFKDILKGNFVASGIDVNDTNQSSDKAKIEFLNRLGQSIHENQKERLPQLLLSLEKSRECIQRVDSLREANECIRELRAIKKEMGEKMPFIYFWNDKEENAHLEKMDEEISNLKSRMSCISRAQNITELSACMK